MAINWLTALKFIPWADVIEATPRLVKGARQLWERTRRDETAPVPVSASPAERVERLEHEVRELREELRASTQLLEQMAEHHARLVDAVERLRVRTRVLMVVSVASLVGALVAVGRLLGTG